MDRIKILVVALLFFFPSLSFSASYYVDSAVETSGNGAAWATAWKAISDITGLAAGDTVYFSGGTSGKSHTISDWTPAGGTKANPIIYAAGLDANHNGMVTFTGTGNFVAGTLTGVTITGEKSGAINLTISSGYTNTVYSDTGATDGFKLLYANFTAAIWGRGGGYEIAYCSGIAPLSMGAEDSYIQHVGDGGTAAWGYNSFHHNYIQVWRNKTAGQGQDALKWCDNIDIYNNTFISTYSASYTGTQHNDGIQTNGNYMRIYNNYYENFISYPIYNEMYGNTTAWRIYNNVIYATESGVDWGAYACMALGWSEAGIITDYIVSNNTCVGPTDTRPGIDLAGGVSGGSIGAGVYLVNNLSYNSGDTASHVAGATLSNNYGGTANITFTNLSAYPTGDFHPEVGSSAVIGQGIRPSYLTDVYTTDKAGSDRGQVWDIGAYEAEPTNPDPDYTLTVTKTGTGTGTVTSSPAGISCGATCTYDFDDDTEVTLNATATSPNYFAGWSGAGCSGTGTCVVTMSEARAVTATFSLYGTMTAGSGGSIVSGAGGSITVP